MREGGVPRQRGFRPFMKIFFPGFCWCQKGFEKEKNTARSERSVRRSDRSTSTRETAAFVIGRACVLGARSFSGPLPSPVGFGCAPWTWREKRTARAFGVRPRSSASVAGAGRASVRGSRSRPGAPSGGSPRRASRSGPSRPAGSPASRTARGAVAGSAASGGAKARKRRSPSDGGVGARAPGASDALVVELVPGLRARSPARARSRREGSCSSRGTRSRRARRARQTRRAPPSPRASSPPRAPSSPTRAARDRSVSRPPSRPRARACVPSSEAARARRTRRQRRRPKTRAPRGFLGRRERRPGGVLAHRRRRAARRCFGGFFFFRVALFSRSRRSPRRLSPAATPPHPPPTPPHFRIDEIHRDERLPVRFLDEARRRFVSRLRGADANAQIVHLDPHPRPARRPPLVRPRRGVLVHRVLQRKRHQTRIPARATTLLVALLEDEPVRSPEEARGGAHVALREFRADQRAGHLRRGDDRESPLLRLLLRDDTTRSIAPGGFLLALRTRVIIIALGRRLDEIDDGDLDAEFRAERDQRVGVAGGFEPEPVVAPGDDALYADILRERPHELFGAHPADRRERHDVLAHGRVAAVHRAVAARPLLEHPRAVRGGDDGEGRGPAEHLRHPAEAHQDRRAHLRRARSQRRVAAVHCVELTESHDRRATVSCGF